MIAVTGRSDQGTEPLACACVRLEFQAKMPVAISRNQLQSAINNAVEAHIF